MNVRILLVEDHNETANLLRMLLSRAGFAVSVAKSVRDAVGLIGEESFDLLVSDIGLPDGTGRDVVRAFRAMSKAPAIALSGFGTEDDIRLGMHAGFTHYLVKPRGVAQLLPLLNKLSAQG